MVRHVVEVDCCCTLSEKDDLLDSYLCELRLLCKLNLVNAALLSRLIDLSSYDLVKVVGSFFFCRELVNLINRCHFDRVEHRRLE